jgi:outer membrane receptor for ferric coprogen and ferric-rhodotorulic acid
MEVAVQLQVLQRQTPESVGRAVSDAAVHDDISHIDSLNDNLRLAVTVRHLANRAYVASCYSYAWCRYGSQRSVKVRATIAGKRGCRLW